MRAWGRCLPGAVASTVVSEAWLSAAMTDAIPEDEDGLVLEVADLEAPMLGARVALSVEDLMEQLTTARPAHLSTVRSASGDAVEGDGLRAIAPVGAARRAPRERWRNKARTRSRDTCTDPLRSCIRCASSP